MPETLPPEIRRLFRQYREGALGTVDSSGPFVSSAGFLYEEDRGPRGSLVFFLSALARHTGNIARDPRASFLVEDRTAGKSVHERPRVTAFGEVLPVEDAARAAGLAGKYREAFPRSTIFLSLPGFRFFEMEIREIHWIGGFGEARRFKA